MTSGILKMRHPWEVHHKSLNFALWTAQILLAVLFGMAGGIKCFLPLETMAMNMAWVADVPGSLVRFIGIVELLGAIGLLLPAMTRILPLFTGYAAVGLAADMALATLFHLTRGEIAMAPVPALLGLLAVFVGWGRLSRDGDPIQAR